MLIDDLQPERPTLGDASMFLPHDTFMAVGLIVEAVDRIVQELKPLTVINRRSDSDHRQSAIEAAGATLAAVEAVKAELINPLIEALTELLAQIIRYGERPEIEGLGRVRVSAPPRKRYDGALLMSALAARLADELPFDRETGEARPPADVMQAAVEIVCAATGATVPSFTGWRKGVLAEHGVALEGYEERESGTKRIKFEGA